MNKKIRNRTEQFNIRLPKELLEDIEEISKILKVNKSEWIKIRLSEIVYQEKQRFRLDKEK